MSSSPVLSFILLPSPFSTPLRLPHLSFPLFLPPCILVASPTRSLSPPSDGQADEADNYLDPKNSKEDKDDQATPEDDDFSSRAQVMTLMTTDVDRVSEFAWHLFSLIGEWVICLV